MSTNAPTDMTPRLATPAGTPPRLPIKNASKELGIFVLLVLLCVVAWLFRLWLAPSVAALAFLLFCCSNAHGLALAWICNRSAIIATLFTLLALHVYVRSRANFSWANRVVATSTPTKAPGRCLVHS